MQGKIISENSVLAENGKEYFCSSIDLGAVKASLGDIVEFTPKGSRATNFKIIEKSFRPQSAPNLERPNFKTTHNQTFQNSQTGDKFEDDDDFWQDIDTEKSTQEYMKQSQNNENLKNKKSFKTLFYIVFIFFIINFFISLANSIKVIKFSF